MKSNSDIRPAIILPLGNGAFHYNFNIVEGKQTNEEGEERTVFEYDTVEVWNEPDYKAVVKAVIREEIDETKEFGYINDYNAATLGVLTDEEAETAKTAYKEYLSFVQEVKTMVKADLEEAGY